MRPIFVEPENINLAYRGLRRFLSKIEPYMFTGELRTATDFHFPFGISIDCRHGRAAR